jgi:hypothetical protein
VTRSELLKARYGHWTSAMHAEMLEGIKKLEREIEAKHFAGRVRVCPHCGRDYSAQGECRWCCGED